MFKLMNTNLKERKSATRRNVFLCCWNVTVFKVE